MRRKAKRVQMLPARQEGAGESSIQERLETGEAHSALGFLPDDSVLQILRHLRTRFLLSSPALVCRRWRRLSSDLVLEIVVSPLSAYNSPWGSLSDMEISQLVISHSRTLERLYFSRPKEPPFEKVLSLVRSLPRLMDFGMVSSSFTQARLETLLDALPSQLQSLYLHNDHILTGTCDEIGPQLSGLVLDTFLQKLSKKHFKLRSLVLSFCSQISIISLDNMLLAIPSIQAIYLQSDSLGWCEVSKILQSCTLLESISLVSRRLFEEPDMSDEEELLYCRKRYQSHQKMLSESASQHADLRHVVHSQLRSIRFYSTPHHSVPLDAMPLLGLLKEKGQQLRELHAQSVYNTSWHVISVSCGHLQTLDLSHDARTLSHSATGVEEVVLSGLFRILKGLERIALPSVTDRVLLDIGRFCSRLKELRCEGHSYRGVAVQHRSEVTDLGVVTVAEGCSNLQVLSLAGCISASVASLRALAFHCKLLKALFLPGCVKIDDNAVRAVWPRIGKSLCVLDLVGCKTTVKTIRMFHEMGQVQATSLVVLAISRSLSKSAKSELLELCQGLPFLHIVKSMSGLPWDGFFCSQSFDDLIPHQRTINTKAV